MHVSNTRWKRTALYKNIFTVFLLYLIFSKSPTIHVSNICKHSYKENFLCLLFYMLLYNYNVPSNNWSRGNDNFAYVCLWNRQDFFFINAFSLPNHDLLKGLLILLTGTKQHSISNSLIQLTFFTRYLSGPRYLIGTENIIWI